MTIVELLQLGCRRRCHDWHRTGYPNAVAQYELLIFALEMENLQYAGTRLFNHDFAVLPGGGIDGNAIGRGGTQSGEAFIEPLQQSASTFDQGGSWGLLFRLEEMVLFQSESMQVVAKFKVPSEDIRRRHERWVVSGSDSIGVSMGVELS